MFLLNTLYNKCFTMNTSFRISLLYLLLIIPQHGNSPLPLMETWLQKDQDDGSFQRDTSSSLTGGDESFGSAHQTYQNSLVRKKKSDDLENALPAIGYRNFALKRDRNRRHGEYNAFFDGRYLNKDYFVPIDESDRANTMFEGLDSAESPYSKVASRDSNLRSSVEDVSNPRFMNALRSDRSFMSNSDPSNVRLERNLNHLNNDLERNTKWSMCKKLKTRYAPNPSVDPTQLLEYRKFDDGLQLQKEYLPLEEEQRGRELRIQEYKDASLPDDKTSQIFDENEYYNAETNPMLGEEDMNTEDVDYNSELEDHSYMQKRDEAKQIEPKPKAETSETDVLMEEGIKSPDLSRSYLPGSSSLQSEQEYLGPSLKSNAKARDVSRENMNRMPDSDFVWKLNSDLQSKDLNNLMRNSQRALQEIQQFQQKLSYKSPDAGENDGGFKRQGRDGPLMKYSKMSFDDKRPKREDEDEQKNMKTGTDEGGGGEYEDEEGKGHKDEEEYYEDADLSNDEPGTEVQTTDELKQKYVKREVPGDAGLKNAEEEKTESGSRDYELSLKNAPVENAENSRKNSYAEGEKTNKNSVRKGVKIWDQWGQWSPCSVTCGVGRSTRWRHCIGGGCAQGEKEAQIKRCTNPACR